MIFASIVLCSGLLGPFTTKLSYQTDGHFRGGNIVHATLFEKTKKVTFTLRNNTVEPLSLRWGDSVAIIPPGKTLQFNLKQGERIYLDKSAAGRPAGSIILEAAGSFDGSTVSVNPLAIGPGLAPKSVL